MKILPAGLAQSIYELFETAKNETEMKRFAAEFAKYLSEKNFLNLLPKIYREIELLEKKKLGIVEAEIISARDLSENEREQILAWAADYLKKKKNKLEAGFQKDESLLGGFLVKTSEILIDRTVRNRLSGLARTIVK